MLGLQADFPAVFENKVMVLNYKFKLKRISDDKVVLSALKFIFFQTTCIWVQENKYIITGNIQRLRLCGNDSIQTAQSGNEERIETVGC